MRNWAVGALLVVVGLGKGVAAQELGPDRARLLCQDPKIVAKLSRWLAEHPDRAYGVFMVGRDPLDSLPQSMGGVRPFYPREALAAGYGGTVVVGVIIGPNGKSIYAEALDVQLLEPPPGDIPGEVSSSPQLATASLRTAALRAVNGGRYRPGFKDGVPVPVFACVPLAYGILRERP